jgi:hypothetical protein
MSDGRDLYGEGVAQQAGSAEGAVPFPAEEVQYPWDGQTSDKSFPPKHPHHPQSARGLPSLPDCRH